MLSDLPDDKVCKLDGEEVINLAPLLELAYGATLFTFSYGSSMPRPRDILSRGHIYGSSTVHTLENLRCDSAEYSLEH